MKGVKVENEIQRYDDEKLDWRVGNVNHVKIISGDNRCAVGIKTGDEIIWLLGENLKTAINNALNNNK